MHEILLPTDIEIDELARDFFARSGFKFEEVPFTFEAARDSFMRTVEKRPPSEDTQQFKDGIIWSNCMALADQDEVILVTNDAAFYEGNRAEGDLSQALAREAATAVHPIKLMSSLSKLLDTIRQDVSADPQRLGDAIREALWEHLEPVFANNDLSPAELQLDADYFASENPDLTYVVFELRVLCHERRSEVERDENYVELPPAVVALNGECGWNESTDTFQDFKPAGIEIIRHNQTGEPSIGKHHFLQAEPLVVGRRTVHYRLREWVS
jgi:hypothetical protein